MHELSSCFVLGFHGCDKEVAQKLVLRKTTFRKSKNTYDWLGHGIYFWLENPRRACEWAKQQAEFGRINQPAVIGAIINLGICLDLTTQSGIEAVTMGFHLLKEALKNSGKNLPENEAADAHDKDKLIRKLDCAVINFTCDFLKKNGISIDTVKGMFTEGQPAFPGACIRERTHTQICVRNPECILGVFYPPREALGEDALLCNDTPC